MVHFTYKAFSLDQHVHNEKHLISVFSPVARLPHFTVIILIFEFVGQFHMTLIGATKKLEKIKIYDYNQNTEVYLYSYLRDIL